MENRTMLTTSAVSIVAAKVAGTALTLTSDNNSPSVGVFRLDANNIEIDGLNGTLIQYNNSAAPTQTIPLPSVFGITVNLGAGYDSYVIYTSRESFDIGAGGVVFQGAGGLGDKLEVLNVSRSLTIAGSVVVRGTAPNTPLLQTGAQNSLFYLGSDIGLSGVATRGVSGSRSHSNTMIGGSMIVNQEAKGAGEHIVVAEAPESNLNILGSISETQVETGSGTVLNEVGSNYFTSKLLTDFFSPSRPLESNALSASIQNDIAGSSIGNISIAGEIRQTFACQAGQSENFVSAQAGTRVSVGGGVTQTATGGAAGMTNAIQSEFGGQIAVRFSVDQTLAGGFYGDNSIFANLDGMIQIGLDLRQRGLCTGSNYSAILALSGGSITVNRNLSSSNVGIGSGFNLICAGRDNLSAKLSPSSFTIGGNVSVSNSDQGHDWIDIQANNGANPLEIGGNLTYSDAANTKGHSDVEIGGTTGSTVNIHGSVTLLLSNDGATTADYSGASKNSVLLGKTLSASDQTRGLFLDGATTIYGGSGADDITLSGASFSGAVVVATGTNPVTSGFADNLTIDGSSFAGGFTASMLGPNAEIDVNNGAGYLPTVFKLPFAAMMPGLAPIIKLAAGSGPGYRTITINSSGLAAGSPKAGGALIYTAANLAGTFILTSNFTKVVLP